VSEEGEALAVLYAKSHSRSAVDALRCAAEDEGGAHDHPDAW
jgi:hypothetical protein